MELKMSKLIWDDEDAPGVADATPEQIREICQKAAAELVLMMEFQHAQMLGQVH